jgi:GT2 family glycosyltransferase
LSIPIEIVIVDNNSDDDSVKYLHDLFPRITIIANNINLGFGAANNIGVSHSHGKYLLLLNPDTILVDDIVSSFTTFYEAHLHLHIGVVGSTLMSTNRTVEHSFGKFPFLLRLNQLLNSHNPTTQKNTPDGPGFFRVDCVVGANMFMRKDTYQQFHGFDENIFLYEEELELQYRMHKEGFISLVLHDTGIIHLKGKSSSNYYQRICSFFSNCYIMHKHLPPPLYVLYRIIWLAYAVVFFKNPRISLREKVLFLKHTIVLTNPRHEDAFRQP